MPCVRDSVNWVFGDDMRAVFERFQLLEQLGSGGEGDAWLALDRSTGKTVVCKKQEFSDVPDGVDRGECSASPDPIRSLLRVVSRGYPAPPIQRFSSGTESWLVCSYTEGVSLDKLSASKSAPFSGLGVVLEILRQLSTEIAALHQHQTMHGDIAPCNVVVKPGGDLALIDFGQSARFGDLASSCGVPGFIAPERLNSGVACAESDAYSLGCLIYWLLTGSLPEILINNRMAVGVVPPRVLSVNYLIEERLAALAAALITLDPHARASLGEARRALNNLQQEIPLVTKESLAALVSRHLRNRGLPPGEPTVVKSFGSRSGLLER